MLLDPPGRPGWPQELPHWPYVQAVDAALLARGIPPGLVRANINSLRWGLTGYMLLQWDASRTHGHGGIRPNGGGTRRRITGRPQARYRPSGRG